MSNEDAEAALHIVTNDGPKNRKQYSSDKMRCKPDAEQNAEAQRLRAVNGKEMMQLDLTNFTLVKCDDGDEGGLGGEYRLISTGHNERLVEDDNMITSDQVQCVIQNSDGDGLSPEQEDGETQYVTVMEGEQGPLVIMQYSSGANSKPLDPEQALLQKIRAQMLAAGTFPMPPVPKKRKTDLPPPHEMLSSPNFKLFLYGCKQCSFKCNATKELSEHKLEKHCRSGRWRGSNKQGNPHLECEECPFKAVTASQLSKHSLIHQALTKHQAKPAEDIVLSEAADEAYKTYVNLLVCGACGYESADKETFKRHVRESHEGVDSEPLDAQIEAATRGQRNA